MTFSLIAHGRLPWDRVYTLLGGCTCFWTDLYGSHVGPPPVEIPIGTHLWAWSAARWLTMRLDGGDAIVGELCDGTDAGEEVTIARDDSWPWRGGHRGIVAPVGVPGPIHLLTTVEPTPLTFLALLVPRTDP